MFTTEEARRDYLRDLSRAGKEYAIAMIEDEYYADRSRLLAWFEARGYRTEARQINEILHLVSRCTRGKTLDFSAASTGMLLLNKDGGGDAG